MKIGEAALPLDKQVLHQVCRVTTPVRVKNKKMPKFCAFHSYNGLLTYHTTEKCKSTMADPNNEDQVASLERLRWSSLLSPGGNHGQEAL